MPIDRTSLVTELQSINAALDDAQIAVQEAQKKVDALNAQASLLYHILRKYREEAASENGHETALGTTATIFSLLRKQPGLSASEIIDKVVPQITTTSKSPKRMVSSMIQQLRKKNKIIRDREKKYRLPAAAE